MSCLFVNREIIQPVALDPLARRSMKTVAKCDKWCDMQVQNLYVNHRIVERTASSLTQERYAPLSVITSSRHRVLSTRCPGSGFTAFGSRFLRCIGCTDASGDLVMNVEVCRRASDARSVDPTADRTRFRTQLLHMTSRGWDDPLDLSILISGGKETNKDSPSNCE